MQADLKGKVALVTGASRGIGRATALALAEAGADVAVNDRIQQAQALEVGDLIRGLDRRTVAVGADVSQAVEVDRMVEAVEWELGPVDILVNNAGMLWQKPLEEITEDDFDAMIAANLKSAFLVTQRVLPAMRQKQWGRIVNLSSVAAQTGGVTGPHYAASKAGLHGLTHSYARHLFREGITVNTVAPALIETDMVTRNLQVSPDLVPVGRFGAAEEVARVIVLLAQNGYITGQTININGGWYMS
uniref:3-oxoacyl-ACP reductase FabG n=1 Tax=Desulfobacca acetoxidans TaxID=60893 RepID=A0A7C3Z3L2_9BACT